MAAETRHLSTVEETAQTENTGRDVKHQRQAK
jgi:hypothetical protein